jgi:hypothetical protein
MITLVVIFFITVIYVVYTVKNNSESCDTLSNDQPVNDILSSLHAHDNYESKYVYYTKHIFETLIAKFSVLY